MNSEHPKEKIVPTPIRKPYVTPRLISYGHVRSLTLAGTKATPEGVGTSTDTAKMVASERALKENIVRVGTHPLGIGLYLFDYKSAYAAKWGRDRQFGVMAEEIEAVMPDAVSMDPQGYRVVNYRMLGISRAGS